MSNIATIVCHGKAVQMTQSLYAAFRMFAATPLLIWADALSIDQQNIPEKTPQLNMMALIYSKAAGVSIWLGCDPYNDAPVSRSPPGALRGLLPEGLSSQTRMIQAEKIVQDCCSGYCTYRSIAPIGGER